VTSQFEVDEWKERIKAIRERLARPRDLRQADYDRLKAELNQIEKLVSAGWRS